MKWEELKPLERELSETILEVCRFEEFDRDSVDTQAPLVGPDSCFGLDSLDMVEIVVAIQSRYGVHIGGQEEARSIFTSLSTLTQFIGENRTT